MKSKKMRKTTSPRNRVKRKKRKKRRTVKNKTKTAMIANKIKKVRRRSKKNNNHKSSSNRLAGSIDSKALVHQRSKRSQEMMRSLRIRIRPSLRQARMPNICPNSGVRVNRATRSSSTSRSTPKKKLSKMD